MSLDLPRGFHALGSDGLWFGICNVQNPTVPPIRLSSSKGISVYRYKLMHKVNCAILKHASIGGNPTGLPNGVKGELGVISVIKALEDLGFKKVAVNQVNGQDFDVHAFKEGLELQLEVKNHKPFLASTYWIRTQVYDRFPNATIGKRTVRILVSSPFMFQNRRAATRLLKKKSIQVVKSQKQVLSVSEALICSKSVASKLNVLMARRRPTMQTV